MDANARLTITSYARAVPGRPARSSTRACSASTRSSLSERMTWRRKLTFLREASTSVVRSPGTATCRGRPGNPPPLPMSSRSEPAGTAAAAASESRKWFRATSSARVMVVRLVTAFHSRRVLGVAGEKRDLLGPRRRPERGGALGDEPGPFGRSNVHRRSLRLRVVDVSPYPLTSPAKLQPVS